MSLADYNEASKIYSEMGDLLDTPGTLSPEASVDIVVKGLPALRQRAEQGPGGEITTTREIINRARVDGEVVEQRRVTVETKPPRTRLI